MLSSLNSALAKFNTGGGGGASRFGTVGDGFEFKRSGAFDQRLRISQRIRDKYPDRIPLIIERSPSSSLAQRSESQRRGIGGTSTSVAQSTQKTKFLVCGDSPIANVLAEMRRQLRLKPEEALFLFVGNGVLPPTAALVSQVYERFKDEDGFLYIAYTSENTFG